MNYTQKYHLPQWEESDRILRTDFNNAMAALEDGLSGNAQGVQEAKNEAAKLPYVVGSYTGTGGIKDITLGFKPSVVLIFTGMLAKHTGSTGGHFTAAGQVVASKVEILDNGFRVSGQLNENDYNYPSVNDPNYPYQYIAFR